MVGVKSPHLGQLTTSIHTGMLMLNFTGQQNTCKTITETSNVPVFSCMTSKQFSSVYLKITPRHFLFCPLLIITQQSTFQSKSDAEKWTGFDLKL